MLRSRGPEGLPIRPPDRPREVGPRGRIRAPFWAGLGLLLLAGCPAGDRGGSTAATGAGSQAQAIQPVVDAGPPAPPPLPFEIEDDRLDVVAAWAVLPAERGSVDGGSGDAGAEAPTAGPILEELPRETRPWSVPLDGALRIELWQRLIDFRVRLLDSQGRSLGSEVLVGEVPTRQRGGEAEPGGTWIEVRPRGGFPPATPCRVVFDGESGPYVLDLKGKAFQDLTLDVVGDSPPAELEAGDGGALPIGSEELP
ncbi:MAG: hypothetical protein P1V51_10540 [Deltaproteobacteria bacterium]|nr:hypothetical protein [Deltaproteobacteria bacterium]